ncbi:MAG TPA: amidoligase family protein [Acidothermaceae bacterium]|nr:amidoligase family protein [Acidothermaceae bacterium]
MTEVLRWRTGFEIELLAPVGSSRRVLAGELATRRGGRVRPVWHHDSEPSLVPGLGRFLHLSQGFDVLDAADAWVCTLVDDVTLVADLDPRTRPAPGWYRVLTDDSRLLRLLAMRIDPGAAIEESLDDVAALWGVPVEEHGEVLQVNDSGGATIALAAPQGGGRERGCEVITPPLSADHEATIDDLLRVARDLGFVVPVEAAVHVHHDGAPFRSAPALANVVRLFGLWRPALHSLLGTNPACLRLAPLPASLVQAAAGNPSYEQLRDAATAGGLTKFFDVNLTALFAQNPTRDTLEVRILPGSIDTLDVVRGAALVEALLERCLDETPIPAPPTDPVAALRELQTMATDLLPAE